MKASNVLSLHDYIDSVLQELDYENNLYFINLESGNFLKEDFAHTQIQFYEAVKFFPRPMAALLAKIPEGNLRLGVIHNLLEEHGEGQIEAFHANTFKCFLNRLDVNDQEIEKTALLPVVRTFNTTLLGACTLDNYLVGTAALGMIENMFSNIAGWIGVGVVKRGWLPADQMIHYTIHKELDIQHAQDFFDILQGPWNESAKDRYHIQQGLLMGGFIFNQLYEELYKARALRKERDVSMAHMAL